MEADLSLKIVQVTLSQSVLECPHCREPGYSFIPPIGTMCLRIVGTCPKCNGVFVIQIIDGTSIDSLRTQLAQNIYYVVQEANKDNLVGISMIADKVKALVLSTPGIDALGSLPEFEIVRSGGSISVNAKNVSASNVLDTLKTLRSDDLTETLTGV